MSSHIDHSESQCFIRGHKERRKTFRYLSTALFSMLVSGIPMIQIRGKGITPKRELSASFSRITTSFPDFALRETRASAQYKIFNNSVLYILILLLFVILLQNYNIFTIKQNLFFTYRRILFGQNSFAFLKQIIESNLCNNVFGI